MIVPGNTCSGSSSESGPIKTVQSPDNMLPTVPDDDNVLMLEVQLLNDDISTISDLFGEKLDKPNDGIVEAGSSMDVDDIYNALGDLGKWAKLSEDGLNFSSAWKVEFAPDQMLMGNEYLELNDLKTPLKCLAEANGSENIPTDGLSEHYNCFNNTEPFCYPVNPCGTVHHVSMLSQSPGLHEGSYWFKNHLDLFQKENGFKENENQRYHEYEATSNNANVTLCKQSELGGRHAPQVQTRGLSTAAPVLPNNQNSSLLTSTLVSGSTCSGSSYESGPFKAVQPPDKRLPTVPDDDNVSVSEVQLPDDDILSMLDSFIEDSTPLSNENDKNEKLDKLNHDRIFEAGFSMDVDNIYDDPGDLGKRAKLSEDGLNFSSAHKAKFAPDQMLVGDDGSYLELNDLKSPLKCPAEANGSENIPTDGLSAHYNCYSNTEQLCYPVNPCGTVLHVSMFGQSPVRPEGSYGFKDHLDVFQKENGVKENENQGYQEYEEATLNKANVTLCKQSEMGGRHAPQVQKREVREKLKSQKKKNSQQKLHSQAGVRIRHSLSTDQLRVVNDNLTDEQRQMIKRTPFHVLLDIPSTQINGYLLSSLIEGWDESLNGFWFKGTFVRFTLHDVACILGLRIGGSVIGVFNDYGSSRLHALLHASFPNEPLTRTHVQNLIEKCASLEDFVRVYIALAFTLFLFPLPSRGIHGHFFSLLDNLDQLGDYGWGKAVYDFLVDGIRHAVRARKEESNSSEIRIKGCVLLLQLWALEHTLMVQAGTSISLSPRIRKWISKNLTNKDVHAIIDITEDYQEAVAILVPTREESNVDVVMESLTMLDNNDDYSPSTPLPSGHGHLMYLPDYKCKYENIVVEYHALVHKNDQLRQEHDSWKGKYEEKCGEYDSLKGMYEEKCREYNQLILQVYDGLMKEKHTSDAYTSASPHDVDVEWYGDKGDAFADTPFHMSPTEDPCVVFLGETSPKRHSESNMAKRIKNHPRRRVPRHQVRILYQENSLKGHSLAVPQPLDEPNVEIEVWLEQHMNYQLDNEKHNTIQEWTDKNYNEVKEIVFNMDGCLVCAKDMECLVYQSSAPSMRRWISNDIVNAYLILLEMRGRSHPNGMFRSSFISSYASQCLVNQYFSIETDVACYLNGLDGHDKVFLPVCAYKHWMLLVADCRNKSIVWLDSMPNASHRQLGEQLGNWMSKVVCEMRLGFFDAHCWRRIYKEDIPLQEENVDDCGIYMLTYIVCLATVGKISKFSKEHTQSMRHRILLELLRGSLLPA